MEMKLNPKSFNDEFFAKWQGFLLWLANTQYGRDLMGITREMGTHDQVIDHVYKNGVRFSTKGTKFEEKGNRQYIFSTQFFIKQNLIKNLKYLWLAAHYFDEFVANPAIPQLNLGFDNLLHTYTIRPDADPETSTVDGYVSYDAGASGISWASLRGQATGTASNDSGTGFLEFDMEAGTTSNMWRRIRRTASLFDSSVIGDSDTINHAEFRTYWGTQSNFSNTLGVTGTAAAAHMCSVSLASPTAVALGDFDAFGSTSWGYIEYLEFTTIGSSSVPASIVFNSGSISNVNKTGITSIGLRIGSDLLNTEPTWSSANTFRMNHVAAAYTQTVVSAMPLLIVVTNSPTATSGGGSMLVGII